jgi:hypothetical protein
MYLVDKLKHIFYQLILKIGVIKGLTEALIIILVILRNLNFTHCTVNR